MSNYGYKKKKSAPVIFEPPCTYTDYKPALHKNEIVNTRFVELQISTISKKTLLMTLDKRAENNMFFFVAVNL